MLGLENTPEKRSSMPPPLTGSEPVFSAETQITQPCPDLGITAENIAAGMQYILKAPNIDGVIDLESTFQLGASTRSIIARLKPNTKPHRAAKKILSAKSVSGGIDAVRESIENTSETSI